MTDGIDYVVFETGHMDRFIPDETYLNFDYIGKATDNHECSTELVEKLHEYLNVEMGYLLFQKKPDVVEVSYDMVELLMAQINLRSFCVNADGFMGTCTHHINIDGTSYDLRVYRFEEC